MPRRSGEVRPLRAVRGSRRQAGQPHVGLGTHAAVVGGTGLRIGQVEGADAGAMANPAIDIKLVGALPGVVGLANFAFGVMVVLMMPHMLRLRRGALVHAISGHRRPAELER